MIELQDDGSFVSFQNFLGQVKYASFENFSSVESSRRFLALATMVFEWILTDRGWMDGWYIQHTSLQRLRCASTEHRMTMIRGAITWSARGLYKSTMVGIWAGDGPLIAVLHRYGDL